MLFDEQYARLECEFRNQIARDNDKDDVCSHYLPNITPAGSVDYVLIGMEPSSGGDTSTAPDEDQHHRNFSNSLQDFILHFCIAEYLCAGGHNYYLTDLSKGAMPVRDAAPRRQCRYRKWYPLLCEELALVAKPDARIIAIGNEVEHFLRKQSLPRPLAGKIIHYSHSAARWWKRLPERHPEQFEEFLTTVCWADVERTVKRVMTEGQMGPAAIDDTLDRLRGGSGLTESKKQLMFSYKCQFETILAASCS